MTAAVAIDAARARLAVDSRCRLGEGVLWCERRQALWWTDIQSARLWRHTPGDRRSRYWRLPDRLGSFALCESGRLLLGLAKGVYSADPGAAEDLDALAPTLLAPVEADQPTLRINDGRCDRSGNFVFGTLNEDLRRAPMGRFYQYSRRHGLRPLALAGVAIANSLCFDLDGRGLYYCDSRQGRIMHVAYDADSAQVGAPEVFAEVQAPASPDGAAVDSEGRVWSAQWGVGRVVGYGHDGRVERVVEVPTSNVSCLSFAGAALDEIYITTAREELDDAQRRAQPDAGGVFRASVAGVRGLAEARFDDR
ncbi:SMP-30/gluconolactonase/LRE family protein [Lysobacter gummosus]|uniref:SMP-30/gluconolactonase/LRE family protein n=1 Tax=Lysobacter gummosus TaxID=262324 RepID=A0ABY3XEW7_9GAMM|nr:SMP-30/gluconolactonase/LRE family protein [Lysobacter gummosus]ALN89283.1 SMP-30/Gluconolaconase/LRE-like region family protein [Lysobacter gummosus]UNP29963.1 SMP-30/gluconolactonase/LRE family protein [Lysobacter gummosus]